MPGSFLKGLLVACVSKYWSVILVANVLPSNTVGRSWLMDKGNNHKGDDILFYAVNHRPPLDHLTHDTSTTPHYPARQTMDHHRI